MQNDNKSRIIVIVAFIR